MGSDSSTRSIYSTSGGIIVPYGTSITTMSNHSHTLTNQTWSGGTIVIELPPCVTTPEGKQITDLKEMYEYVSKLYFDSQMKELIDEDTTT